MKQNMKSIFALTLIAASVTSVSAFAAGRPVTVRCTVGPGATPQDVESPYGGGKNIAHIAADGSSVVVTVMIETNQDNKDLIDMQLLVSRDSKHMAQAGATGVAENQYKENGVNISVGSVNVKCGI